MNVHETTFSRCDAASWPRLVWALAAPLRLHATRPPFTPFKRFLSRQVFPALLPGPPAHLIAHVPGRGRVRIDYDEEIALLLLMHGAYEAAELKALAALAEAGSTAIDVGANLGIYTVTLGIAVGDTGRVLALEPVPATIEKLRANIQMNRLANVNIVIAAAADKPGATDIHLAKDSAYASLNRVKGGRANNRCLRVRVVTLDELWQEAGRPKVSVCKIDVEGAELAVLDGAAALLDACRPALLLEADEGPQLDSVTTALAPLGYRRDTSSGFAPWNHLFLSK
jgi:FkbM family methyltransferase